MFADSVADSRFEKDYNGYGGEYGQYYDAPQYYGGNRHSNYRYRQPQYAFLPYYWIKEIKGMFKYKYKMFILKSIKITFEGIEPRDRQYERVYEWSEE